MMRYFKAYIIIVLTFLSIAVTAQDLKLWYEQPAEVWEEALPIGNGRLGAMVFGTPGKEHLQFNEETLWDGGPRQYQHPGAAEHLDTLRQLLSEGRQDEAEAIASKYFMGKRSFEDDYPEKVEEYLKVLSEKPELVEALKPAYNDSEWREMNIQGKSVWERKMIPDLVDLDGCLIFRKTVTLNKDWANKELVLNMGKIKDHDFTYFNGVKIGEMNGSGLNRVYTVPDSLVKEGENFIVVQIINYTNTGGFNAVRSGYKVMHLLNPEKEDEPIFIEGIWKYKVIDEKPPYYPEYQADYQPFGDLEIEFKGHEDFSDYYRELDLKNAIVKTSYTHDGTHFTREYFSSWPDQSIQIHLTADREGAINFKAGLSTIHSISTIATGDSTTLYLHFKVEDGVLNGVAMLNVSIHGGSVVIEDQKIIVKDANEATLRLVAATNYVNYRDVSADPVKRCVHYLDDIQEKSFEEVKANHINDYQSYFNRFAISFGPDEKSRIPTDQRIENIKAESDNGLAALYVQYSRYLMISSGRPGTNPPNLQGIWNKDYFPAWGSKYTTNINCEMNFLGVEQLNLSECHQSLFSMIDELQVEGRKTAKIHYNARGWVHHHNTDQWRGTAPINNSNHGIWVTGGAWLCHHLWEHYLYTQDKEWLAEKAYPVIRDAALFFVDFLVEDAETGYLISTPSNSPENGGLVAGPAMDHQIIRSLFKIAIASNRLTVKDKKFEKLIESKLEKVMPDHVGRLGQLQEWKEDIDNPENHHRHVSHLWGVYPGREITWEQEELMNAAKQSLLFRGDEGTGWSLAWKINFWARFLDGEHAHRLVDMLLSSAEDSDRDVRGGAYPNLFDAHPPFQIDGNFGGAAGMIEMIMQSHTDYIHLLPALPKDWKDGEVKGLRARGGFIIDMKWENSQVVELTIKSIKTNRLRVQVNGELIEKELKAGEVYSL